MISAATHADSYGLSFSLPEERRGNRHIFNMAFVNGNRYN